MTLDLEARYRERCYRLADELYELLGAPRARFLEMLRAEGPVVATKRHIHKPPSETFGKLWERGRLNLTVEAVIVTEREWDPLFRGADRNAAEQRLRDVR